MTENNDNNDNGSDSGKKADGPDEALMSEPSIADQQKYKVRLAAIEKLSGPLNNSALDAIKKMAEQQSHAAELYKQSFRFPNIAEMLGKANVDQFNSLANAAGSASNTKLAEAIQKIVNSPLVDTAKKIDGFSKSFKQMDSLSSPLYRWRPTDEVLHDAMKGIRDSERKIAESKQKEREFNRKVGNATLEQSKHLASLAEQNAILVQAMTQLLEHTVKFETEKSSGAKNQYNISVWALWAAVISAVISFAGILYSVFWQLPPQVTVSPPAVSVTTTPPNLDPIIQQFQMQTEELKSINKKLQKPKSANDNN